MADKIKEQLPEFFIEGKPTEPEVVLGKGSYGVVRKVIVDETECAAKIIYGSISFSSEVGNKYVQELSLQSNLRHPNITQFLGICNLPDSSLPALVTELMHSNLHDFLTNPHLKEAIPLSYKKSILEDVSKGLIYLHNKSITHRDLTAKNVLLTASLVAKIADLGNSRILPEDKFADLTSQPGTTVYMPPEASSRTYTDKLDIFSFGHLTLFTMIQEFPEKLPHPTYPDPNSMTESVKGLTEVERREEYFEIMKGKLPQDVHDTFADLIKRCLAFSPQSRPKAVEILHRLRQVQLPRDYEGLNSIEAALIEKYEIEEGRKRLMREHEQTIQEMQDYIGNLLKDVDLKNKEIQQKDREIFGLQGRLRALETHDLARLEQRQNQPEIPNGTQQIAQPIDLKLVPKQRRVPPIKMSNYPQAVVLNDRIYMGGGFTRTEDIVKILEFDPQQEIWKDLAKCPAKYFGMAVVKKELLIIGGTELPSNTKTGRVYSFDFDSKEWNLFKCTSMLTHRSMPSVVSYDDKWLIALGGEDKNGQVLSSVEKLNIENPEDKCHWSRCPNLPVKCAHFSSTIIDNKLFTFGTTTYGATMSVGMPSNSVFYAPLEELILGKCDAYTSWEEIQLPPAPPTPSVSLWQELHHLPLKASTAVSFEGSLFALGGTEKSYAGASTSIFKLEYTENPDDKRIQNAEWKKVGDLPIALCQCACVQNGNCIFVHGRRMKVADVCVYTLTIDS